MRCEVSHTSTPRHFSMLDILSLYIWTFPCLAVGVVEEQEFETLLCWGVCCQQGVGTLYRTSPCKATLRVSLWVRLWLHMPVRINPDTCGFSDFHHPHAATVCPAWFCAGVVEEPGIKRPRRVFDGDLVVAKCQPSPSNHLLKRPPSLASSSGCTCPCFCKHSRPSDWMFV